ncbi:MAG: hypothetical protein AAF596_06940 [Planctomycetota bacterium]
MRRTSKAPTANRGSILLAVLVLVAVMTVGGLSYFNWTNTERRASAAFTRQAQTLAAAESGAEFLRVYLSEEPSLLEQDGGLYDNPGRFQGVIVDDSAADSLRTRFSMLAPNLDVMGVYDGYRFGLENESARINLNTVLLADDYVEDGARQMLTSLPGVTDSIADAILDWIDEDDEPRAYGAELSYYSTLVPSYAPANRPLQSLDELLLVRDIGEALLYGLDRDRNFVIDSDEALLALDDGVENLDGSANRGLAAYLTLSSAERNVDINGDPRIDLNQDDLELLHGEVEQALGLAAANFIVAYRQGGAEQDSNGGSATSAEQVQIDFEVPGSETISSVLSLVGVRTSTTPLGDDRKVTVETPFPNDPSQMLSYLPDLLDYVTVTSDATIPGRVNVNQAPRAVLQGLPGMPPEVVDLIVSARTFDPASIDPTRRHAAWMLAEGLIELEAMQELEPFVTGTGDVYRTQITGYFDAGGMASRLEVVVDATEQPPVLRRRRDLTPLGSRLSSAELSGIAGSAVEGGPL